jgi:hypothetical protein
MAGKFVQEPEPLRKTEDVELRSDNLESLMAYYSRLSEKERKSFEAALLDRLDPDRG